MSQTDEKMIRLERAIATSSGEEKLALEKRLQALLAVKETPELDPQDQNDDIFDNLPV